MRIIVKAAFLFPLLVVGQIFGANGAPVLPSDLKGQCEVVSATTMMDDYESGSMTVIDQYKKRLFFYYSSDGRTIMYGQFNTGRAESEAGGTQEQILLKILKQAVAIQFTPPPIGNPSGNGNSKFWTYRAAGHFMRVLEYRCRQKSAIIPWGVVMKSWAWGGNW
jgi:hypothetical protein